MHIMEQIYTKMSSKYYKVVGMTKEKREGEWHVVRSKCYFS